MVKIINYRYIGTLKYFIVILLPHLDTIMESFKDKLLIYTTFDIGTLLRHLYNNKIILAANDNAIDIKEFVTCYMPIKHDLYNGNNLYIKNEFQPMNTITNRGNFCLIYPRNSENNQIRNMSLETFHQYVRIVKDIDKSLEIYIIGGNNKTLEVPGYKRIHTFLDYIDYFKHCSLFITSESGLKDYALNSGCKKIIISSSELFYPYTYKYNPFRANMLLINEQSPNRQIIRGFIMDKNEMMIQNIHDKYNGLAIHRIIDTRLGRNEEYDNNKISRIAIDTIDIMKADLNSQLVLSLEKYDRDMFDNDNVTIDLLKHVIALIKLCKRLHNTTHYHVIIDGNIRLCEQFEDRLIDFFENHMPANLDVCYLSDMVCFSVDAGSFVKKLNGMVHLLKSAYLISPKGVGIIKSILDTINLDTMHEVLNGSLDSMLMGAALQVYSLKQPISHNYDSLLLTAGIGDFILLDYFYDLTKYKNIFLVLPQDKNIEMMMSCFKNYKKVQIIKYNCLKRLRLICFVSLNNILDHRGIPQHLKLTAKYAHDYSIFSKLGVIRRLIGNGDKINICRYCDSEIKVNSSLVKNKLCDTRGFNLPSKYYFIASSTSWTRFDCAVCDISHETSCPKTDNMRDFVDIDWVNTINILQKENIKGIVIGVTPVPSKYASIPLLINLTNKTSIIEAFEILKYAIGYIGIDTCFSVLASYTMPKNKVMVKCINKHGLIWKDIYFYNKEGPIPPLYNI